MPHYVMHLDMQIAAKDKFRQLQCFIQPYLPTLHNQLQHTIEGATIIRISTIHSVIN